MEHTISIEELLKREKIREDKEWEFLNKMTDDEIKKWELEIDEMLKEEGVPKKLPDWNAAFLAKIVDRNILYNLLKLK